MSDTPNPAAAAAPAASATPPPAADGGKVADTAATGKAEAVADDLTAEEVAALAAEEAEEVAKAEKSKTAKAPAEPKKKWKVKADGVEEELDEETLVQRAALARGAQKRIQEASELKRNMEQFLQVLRTDPARVLSDPNLKIDPSVRKKLAEQILANDLEEMTKTPEQKEREKLQKELTDLQEQHKKNEDDRKSRDFQRLQEQAAVQLDTDISSALQSGGLPKTPYTVKKMAEVLSIALQHNIELSAAEAVPLIRKQMSDEIKEMFSLTSEDLIEEFLGKENIGRLRKRSLARIKTPMTPAPVVESTESAKKSKGQSIPFKKLFGPF